MVIVETKTEIYNFLKEWDNYPSIIVPIFEDLNKHPLNNKLSFLFIRIRNVDYVISYSHIDCISVNIDLSKSLQPKWVWNKKAILQSNTNIQNIFDIQSYYFFTHNKLLELTISEQSFISHYHHLRVYDNLGKIAPIMKWGEYLGKFINTLNGLEYSDNMKWINDTMIPVLSDIERYGISVDIAKLKKRFPKSIRHVNNGIVYTEYNPYTATSRPSNRHGGVNYSALNKTDGSREILLPKSDSIFLQFDYDAYHIRIISNLIGYKLPDSSAHQWLADQYGVDYDEGKSITFKLLYGGIPEEFEAIPYFKEVKQYIEVLWKRANSLGYIETNFRKIPLSWVEDNNPQKSFNYLLQALETEMNIGKLETILKYIKDTDIELSLYSYDSFLFSFPNTTPTDVAKELKSIIETGGYPTRVTWGTNYDKV
jgi:hypothetical protein